MASIGLDRAGMARRVGRDFGVSVVAPDELAAIAADWAVLARRPESGNLFFHPEFAIPAIGHFGRGVLAVAAVYSPSGSLMGLAPFGRTRLGRIAPAIRLCSHKYAPFGEPLVDADDIDGTLAGLVEGLAPEGSGLSFILPEMVAEGPIAEAVRAHAFRRGRPLVLLNEHRRAMLARATVSGDLRAGLSSGRRKELGRQLRRLGEVGLVSFTSDVDPDCVRARFEEFLALEQTGWKGRQGTALASSVTTAQFSREALFNLAESGKARIDSLRVGAHPVAIVVSLIAGTVAYTWKIAYDEAYAQYSPGAQLMLEAPAHLFADGQVTLIDSCATADHPMIDKLWPERRGIATFVLGPPGGGTLFSIGLATERAELAARANVRQLRNRLG
jgi:CelD/BcsL family acetyltransferase involved in cellulose biosynthesis